MIRALAFALTLGWPALVMAQADPVAQAREAIAQLEAAGSLLNAAEKSRDRVQALTQTIQALEAGLAAMRTGARQAALREKALSTGLQAREQEVAGFLTVLQSISRTDRPTALLHPDGPSGMVRAGMLLADMTPALAEQVEQLQTDLQDIQTLRALQADAVGRLTEGLQQLQQARTDLNQAIANRTDLPRRFVEDPVRTAILIASAETLEGFASGLTQIAGPEDDSVIPSDTAIEPGDLLLPVQGALRHGFKQPDAAGVARPGILVATEPNALVVAPAAATVRYAGPLLDLGTVVILEPQADLLLVLAGLGVVYGETGQVLEAGAPIGMMEGQRTGADQDRSTDGDPPFTERSETLYIEVRQDNVPQDPAFWFRTDEDGQ